MTDQPRETGAILDPELTSAGRPAPAPADDDEGVGYARADLRDALARIRDSVDPARLDDLDRDRSPGRPSDDERRAVEDIRAIAVQVERIVALTEAVSVSTATLLEASARHEEHLARLSEAIDESRAAQARAEQRILWLTLAIGILVVIIAAMVAIGLLG